MNDLVNRDCEPSVNLAIRNKAKLHTDTHIAHTQIHTCAHTQTYKTKLNKAKGFGI